MSPWVDAVPQSTTELNTFNWDDWAKRLIAVLRKASVGNSERWALLLLCQNGLQDKLVVKGALAAEKINPLMTE